MRTHLPRGVYTNMPAEIYHLEPSLSASAIKMMMVSPLDYWTNFLSPNKPNPQTPSMALGEAIHKMVLEGPEEWNREFIAKPHMDDYPGCINGTEALKAKCDAVGAKKTGTMLQMAWAIKEKDNRAVLWPIIMEQFEQATSEGKQRVVGADVGNQCRRARAAIQGHVAGRHLVQGGLSEVSIFYEDFGIPMKVRLDYLKPRSVVEVKTFSNTNRLNVETAIVKAVASLRYHVQAVLYTRAAIAAKALIRDGMIDGNNAALEQYASITEHPRFYFLFLETGEVANVLVREFVMSHPNAVSILWEKGLRDIQKTVQLLQGYMKKLGPDQPWVMDAHPRAFMDEEFPSYFLES